jgi:hypothetical protein
MQWGDLAIFLCSHGGPMERFLDRRDQENSKHKEERDRSGKITKTRKKWEKDKEEMCSPLIGTALLRPSPQENHSYGNLPYNIFLLDL